jgi:hypothetical protein
MSESKQLPSLTDFCLNTPLYECFEVNFDNLEAAALIVRPNEHIDAYCQICGQNSVLWHQNRHMYSYKAEMVEGKLQGGLYVVNLSVQETLITQSLSFLELKMDSSVKLDNTHLLPIFTPLK